MQVTIVVDTDAGGVQVTESDDTSGLLVEAMLNAAVGKVRRAYHLDRSVTPGPGDDIAAVFKAAWHAADQRGEKGHRTEAGLDAVRDFENRSKKAGAPAEGCS